MEKGRVGDISLCRTHSSRGSGMWGRERCKSFLHSSIGSRPAVTLSGPTGQVSTGSPLLRLFPMLFSGSSVWQAADPRGSNWKGLLTALWSPTVLYSLSIGRSFPGVHWKLAVFVFWAWLVSPNLTTTSSPLTIAQERILFFLWISNIPLCSWILSHHLSVHKHLGWLSWMLLQINHVISKPSTLWCQCLCTYTQQWNCWIKSWF